VAATRCRAVYALLSSRYEELRHLHAANVRFAGSFCFAACLMIMCR
jgi:hypothetical protein